MATRIVTIVDIDRLKISFIVSFYDFDCRKKEVQVERLKLFLGNFNYLISSFFINIGHKEDLPNINHSNEIEYKLNHFYTTNK